MALYQVSSHFEMIIDTVFHSASRFITYYFPASAPMAIFNALLSLFKPRVPLKVKKYKKASRATPALDTSVVLECVLI